MRRSSRFPRMLSSTPMPVGERQAAAATAARAREMRRERRAKHPDVHEPHARGRRGTRQIWPRSHQAVASTAPLHTLLEAARRVWLAKAAHFARRGCDFVERRPPCRRVALVIGLRAARSVVCLPTPHGERPSSSRTRLACLRCGDGLSEARRREEERSGAVETAANDDANIAVSAMDGGHAELCAAGLYRATLRWRS